VHPGRQDDGRRSRHSTRAQHPQGQGERSCETSLPGLFPESIPREEPGCIGHHTRERLPGRGLDEFFLAVLPGQTCFPERPLRHLRASEISAAARLLAGGSSCHTCCISFPRSSPRRVRAEPGTAQYARFPRGMGQSSTESSATQTRVFAPDGSSFVSCNCGCGDKPAIASQYYYGALKCSKGGA
jgi:hypothetical protein